jgi:GrpB-like predicted nucleotidyltransferase (UPF0157 family)
VEQTNIQWQEYITFRDALRLDPRLCHRYSSLKRRLAVHGDRKSYTDGKHRFIQEVLREHAQHSICERQS